ncbi:MAG: adenylate kinase [Mycetocola sp.]
MHLLIMGPPGAGKGTQAVGLAARVGGPHISTGDIFRANVRDQTALGRAAQGYLDAGEYVPDDVTNAMVGDRLAESDARGAFVLDGYPRTVDQVATLDTILERLGSEVDVVIELAVDADVLIGRLLDRARTSGRTDDTESIIRRRQEVYLAETAPLLEAYGRRGLVAAVDGTGTVDEVARRIGAALPLGDPAGREALRP